MRRRAQQQVTRFFIRPNASTQALCYSDIAFKHPACVRCSLCGSSTHYETNPYPFQQIYRYYQFFPATGSTDSLFIITFIYGEVTGVTYPIAIGGVALGGTGSTYKQFSAPIFYGVQENPDSAWIEIFVGGSDRAESAASIGSYFLIDDLAFAGTAQTTSVNADGASTPGSFELQQNYPNPFNPSTKINFSVAQAGHVTLKVYNVLGTEVASLVNEQKDAGTFSVNWNAAGLPSGMYIYRISVTSDKGQLFDQAKKLVLLK